MIVWKGNMRIGTQKWCAVFQGYCMIIISESLLRDTIPYITDTYAQSSPCEPGRLPPMNYDEIVCVWCRELGVWCRANSELFMYIDDLYDLHHRDYSIIQVGCHVVHHAMSLFFSRDI